MESAPASSTTKHWYFRRFVGYNVHVSIGLANLPMRTKFTAHALAWTHAWVPQISFKIGAGRRKFKIDESPLTWTLPEAKNLTMNVHVTSSWILFKTCLSVHVSGTVTCVTLTRCKWCFLGARSQSWANVDAQTTKTDQSNRTDQHSTRVHFLNFVRPRYRTWE